MASGTTIPQALVFIADSYEGVLELIRAREAEAEVTSYDEAVHQANIACDLAMRKTFNKSLADVYWDHARGRAYENDENNALRPSDSEREPFTFNEDRFNSDTVARYTFTRNEETAVISYDTAPMVLRDIPPLSTRAVILSASGVSGDVVVSVNAFDWAPDLAGNSMRVKIYEDGSDGEELNAQQAQVVLSGLGIPDGFSRAIVVFSNVTMDKSYSAALIATMKAVPIEEPMGLLAGLVTKGGTDNALAGVDVIVKRRIGDFVGAQLGALKTDSLGIYYFPLLPVGDIQITFTKDGYLTAKRNATVTARKLTVVSAALFPIE
jgi:hypothetical protein